MEMKLIKNKKYLQQNISQMALVTQKDNRLYVEGRQELCPFYMSILHGNAFCTSSAQVVWVKNDF